MLLRWSGVIGLVTASLGPSSAMSQEPQSSVEWRDPSPHQVRFVAVAPEVQLEVLDWGGSGEPLVLLAGLNFTAHTFDNIALRLARQFRVLAITRRGFGASSQPDSGYDMSTLAEDVRIVLDSLRIGRAALGAHSMGGEEITRLAVRWPQRVSHLVYLDTPMVPSDRLDEMMRQVPPPPAAVERDRASVAAYTAYLRRIAGVEIPEAEVRSQRRVTLDGRVQGPVTPAAVLQAIVEDSRPSLGDVRVPVLAVRAVPRTPAGMIPWYSQLSAQDRDKIVQMLPDLLYLLDVGWEPFRDIEDIRWLRLPDASHHVYLSHEEQVVAAISDFLTERR